MGEGAVEDLKCPYEYKICRFKGHLIGFRHDFAHILNTAQMSRGGRGQIRKTEALMDTRLQVSKMIEFNFGVILAAFGAV